MFRAATIATVAAARTGAAGCLVASVVRRGGGRTGAKVIGDGRIYLPPEFEKKDPAARWKSKPGVKSRIQGANFILEYIRAGWFVICQLGASGL
jgi:hypothetical protein